MNLKNATNKLRSSKFYILLLGIASTVWFLIRVLPKPSRAAYPCMRVAAPFMSTLVLYLLSLGTTTFAFKHFHKNLKNARFATAGLFLLLSIGAFSVYLIQDKVDLFANESGTININKEFTANNPIGEAKGLNPGRVAWVHHAEATNKDMTNTAGDYWYMDKNVNTSIINQMLQTGLKSLTGEQSTAASWSSIFKYFNDQHGKGSVGYKSGEKIFIKTNFTNSCCGQIHRMDATPQLMLVLLKSLIEDAGVPQSNIYIGDPFRDFKDFHLDPCYNVYPNVNYIGPNAVSPVQQTVATASDILVFSDGVNTAHIPQINVDAEYFINMPCLKSHDVGGITINAKNHQGSVLEPGSHPDGQSAFFMHYSLANEDQGQGKYRHLVDYMAHEHLGGKTLLYLVDAIWGGDNWEGNIFKWQMDPFNDDYPSSILLSQDPVAIDAVCYDILLEEYTNPPNGTAYPYIDGTDDYLYQAASSDNWPAGISYDPEGDGSVIGSLGVFEHWNNPTDRQYSRNLGTGDGIELNYVTSLLPVGFETLQAGETLKAYPNPFSIQTTIELPEGLSNAATLTVYDLNGKTINTISINGQTEAQWHGDNDAGAKVASGMYIFTINDKTLKSPVVGKVSLQ